MGTEGWATALDTSVISLSLLPSLGRADHPLIPVGIGKNPQLTSFLPCFRVSSCTSNMLWLYSPIGFSLQNLSTKGLFTFSTYFAPVLLWPRITLVKQFTSRSIHENGMFKDALVSIHKREILNVCMSISTSIRNLTRRLPTQKNQPKTKPYHVITHHPQTVHIVKIKYLWQAACK